MNYRYFISNEGIKEKFDTYIQELKDIHQRKKVLIKELNSEAIVDEGGNPLGFIFQQRPQHIEKWIRRVNPFIFYIPKKKNNMEVFNKLKKLAHKNYEKFLEGVGLNLKASYISSDEESNVSIKIEYPSLTIAGEYLFIKQPYPKKEQGSLMSSDFEKSKKLIKST